MAERALHAESPAVFRMYDTMVEPATHAAWARGVIARERMYGIRPR